MMVNTGDLDIEVGMPDPPAITVTIGADPETVTTAIPAQLVVLTRAEFDLLDPPDASTIYIVMPNP